MINTDNLPEPDVLKMPTYEEVLAENVALFTTLMPDYEPLDSDPYQLLLQVFAYRELHLRQAFNNKLKSQLLLYAAGTDLDLLAADEYQLERLDGESDLAFRQRILRSLDGYSTAGSIESYEYHAYSVSSDITEAKAYSPEKGVVHVVIASNTMDIDDGLKTQVENRLNEDKVRPLTDTVSVVIASAIEPVIAGVIELHNLDEKEAVMQSIINNITGLVLGIGDDLPYSQRVASLHVPGVYRVMLEHGDDIECDQESIIRIAPEQLHLTFEAAAYA
ncbi:MAG: baseplate assembly protein [Vibrio sp.]